jgi:Zn-finger protein
LYFLGNNCGGDFSRLPNGVKDCSQCIIPHRRENYERIIARLEEAIMHVWDS